MGLSRRKDHCCSNSGTRRSTAQEQWHHSNRFDVVANAFRQKEGFAFAEVLSAERIKQAFQEENGLFGQDDFFSTDIVLWAFLAQTLRDGEGAARRPPTRFLRDQRREGQLVQVLFTRRPAKLTGESTRRTVKVVWCGLNPFGSTQWVRWKLN